MTGPLSKGGFENEINFFVVVKFKLFSFFFLDTLEIVLGRHVYFTLYIILVTLTILTLTLTLRTR